MDGDANPSEVPEGTASAVIGACQTARQTGSLCRKQGKSCLQEIVVRQEAGNQAAIVEVASTEADAKAPETP